MLLMLESGIMVRKYLDEIVPVNSGIIGQYISPVGPFSEPMYAMVDNDTIAATPAPTRTRSSKSKKKKSNKPKNDGIIRNHDSVWDYKIQDGKLLTRRKGNKSWIDISDNDVAVDRIQKFTGKTIEQRKPESNAEPARTPAGGPFGGKTYDELTAILDNVYNNKSNNTSSKQNRTLKNSIPRYRTIDTTVGAITPANDGGLVYPTGAGLYYISPKTKAIAEAHGETDMLGEYIPEGPVRREFTEPYMTSNDSKRTIADYVPRSAPGMNWLNYTIGYAIPGLGDSVRKAINRVNLGDTNYINLMKMLGIDVFAPGNERYYPM